MLSQHPRALTFIVAVTLVLGVLTTPQPAAAGPVAINSYSPSVGWAGTTATNGTLVKILGTGFSSVPTGNDVRFTDGGGLQTIAATVEWSVADGDVFDYDGTIGSPGTGLGELDHPWDVAVAPTSGDIHVVNLFNKRVEVFNKSGTPVRQIGSGVLDLPWGVAVDAAGNVYVSDRNSALQDRVAVFDKNGTSIKTIGAGTLTDPRWVAVDSTGAVYVVDQAVGSAELYKFNSAGTKIFSITGPTAEPFQQLEDVTLASSGQSIYLTDRGRKAIYKYSTAGAFEAKKSLVSLGLPAYLVPESVTVDWEGKVYVQVGDALLVKLDSSLNKLSEITLPAATASQAHLRAIDTNKQLLTVDYLSCDCVRVFDPTDAGELWVRVPPGAQTGPIKVTVSGASANSGDFTVLTVSGTPNVPKVEITQGVPSYPFVIGKDTLVYAKIAGAFGHPTRDRATISIRKASQQVGLIHNFDATKTNYSGNETIATYDVPYYLVEDPGQYVFHITLARDGNVLYDQSHDVFYSGTKGQAMVFFKFSAVDSTLWTTQDPAPWFDMATFLRGVDHYRRMYPLDPQEVIFRFGPAKYLDFLADGLDDTDKPQTNIEVAKLRNKFREDNPNMQANRFVGLVDSSLRQVNANGWARLTDDVTTTFFGACSGTICSWGRTLAHEIGHTYGLVGQNQANFDPTQKLPNGKPQHHSKNQTLSNEDGAPLVCWNSITDQFMDGAQIGSVMGYNGGGESNSCFESKFQGERVDYWALFEEFRNTAAPPSASIASTTQQLVLLGTIGSDGSVTVDESYLSSAALPSSSVGTGEYELVFIDSAGQTLRADTFEAPFALLDGGLSDRAVLDLIRPYPVGTAAVEIRDSGTALATLTPSQTPPAVTDVTVSLQASSTALVSWAGSDPDGDSLTYAVSVSVAGADSLPLAAGLTGTSFVWDHSLNGGGSNAVVTVTASDGFHRNSGTSAAFTLPDKAPAAAILLPAAGGILTEGAPVELRAAAFDAEDGIMAGGRLLWTLDGEALGTGITRTVREITRTVPAGAFEFPLEVGSHTVQLTAEDSDGRTALASVSFTVVADTDRDGIADSAEVAAGSDPTDPFARPHQPPVADAGGPYTVAEGDQVVLDGSGSFDPDDDPLVYLWDFGDGSPTVNGMSTAHVYADDALYTVTLTVTDPEGLSDSTTTVVQVHNVAPDVAAGDDRTIDEGAAVGGTLATFFDPGALDTHTATVDWGDGSPSEAASVTPVAGTVSGSHAYGDNGVFTVTVTVLDDDGASGSDTFLVTVGNVSPEVAIDDSGAIQFTGGLAFLGRLGVEQSHEATATDPGSDDLEFAWSFGKTTTYYNNGIGPDPYPSPAGVFPFTRSDAGQVIFNDPGVHLLGLTVTDDDGGTAGGEVAKLVTGGAECTRSQGYWIHEYLKAKGDFDDTVLTAYLDLVGYTSAVFSEEVPAGTITEAGAVLKPAGNDMRDKALAQTLAAWLNFANGAVGWTELIDTDGDRVGDMAFNNLMATVESILLDPGADHAALEYAKDLAEAVNLSDGEHCS